MEFNDFVNAILHGGILTLSIFIMLLALSVVTWGIIIGKVIQLRREDLNSGKFVDFFNKSTKLRGIVSENQAFYDFRRFFQEMDQIAIPLREKLKSYCISIVLNDTNKYQLFIPQGFGHAFLTLSKEAIVSYKIDSGYNSSYESGIRYNDPQINIKWALDDNEIILSDKDRNLPAL